MEPLSGMSLSAPSPDLLQPRDRRREKPLLSCTFCRSRKVRCDRQLPCKTCISRGVGHSCTYRPGPSRDKVSVGDRIQQLEALVRSLVQQQQTFQTPAAQTDGLGSVTFQNTPTASSPQGTSASSTLLASVDDGALVEGLRRAALSNNRDHGESPMSSDAGSIHLHSHGVKYVGSVHWAAVLDSISELRDHYEEEEEARMLSTSDNALGPRLLYEPVQTTKAELLASIPARPVVDRMLGRYFNAHGLVPEIIHRGHFFREYERFWQEPNEAPFIWIGVLFSIMCLSTQYQQFIEDPADPDTAVRVRLYRERTIHCLVLGQYTKGGDYVLETLINYLASEMFLSTDTEVGIWLVQGKIVQLALSRGYHRDPQTLSNISPFAGEMRRRVWAIIVQMDIRLSSQMALPRLLKLQQYDTLEPRNLLDTDFDEDTVELPLSRPETEVTPVLYSLARTKIDKMNGLVSDLINDMQEHPYTEIMELDCKIQEAEASLPPIFRWEPLSQSFMVLPQIVMHRVLLQLAIQRLTIWLHRKYLSPTYAQAHYKYSQNACVQAAIKLLEFQQIVDEETRRDGLLYPVRWMFMSSRLQAVFLLGISILCYYVQLLKTLPDVSLDQDTGTRIHSLLNNTYPLWVRLSTVSREARRAVEHLDFLLGLRKKQEIGVSLANTTTTTSPAVMALDAVQFTSDAFEGCMADIPATESFSANAPESSVETSTSLTDLLLSNTTDLDDWMARWTG